MHTIPVTAVSWTLANISGRSHHSTSHVVKPSVVVNVVLVHNRTIPIAIGFTFSPRKRSSGRIYFAVIAYPSPLSRRCIFLQANEIVRSFHTLNSVSQEVPFTRTFNRNKITSSLYAMSSTFSPIQSPQRVFMKCVTRSAKVKEQACPS